jgi:hypothetical protein
VIGREGEPTPGGASPSSLLGNIYVNRPGVMVGDVLLINGEGVAGSVLGLGFVAWFLIRERQRARPAR